SDLYRSLSWRDWSCTASVQSPQSGHPWPWNLLVYDQEHCGGELPAGRSTVCFLPAKSTGTVDSVCGLKTWVKAAISSRQTKLPELAEAFSKRCTRPVSAPHRSLGQGEATVPGVSHK